MQVRKVSLTNSQWIFSCELKSYHPNLFFTQIKLNFSPPWASHPTTPGSSEPRAELPELDSSFPLAVCSTHGRVCFNATLLESFLLMMLWWAFMNIHLQVWVPEVGSLPWVKGICWSLSEVVEHTCINCFCKADLTISLLWINITIKQNEANVFG